MSRKEDLIMKLNCLLLLNKTQTSHIETIHLMAKLSNVDVLNVHVKCWADASVDIIQHADIVIADGDHLSSKQRNVLSTRSKLHFSRTLVVEKDTCYPSDLNLSHLNFASSVDAILAWLKDYALPATTAIDVDHLVGQWRQDMLSHLKTDHFQALTYRWGKHANSIADARKFGKRGVEEEYTRLSQQNEWDIYTLTDMLLSLRMFKCYELMSSLYHSIHPILQQLDLFKEQFVFAQNRLAKSISDKLELIKRLETIRQPSSETLSIAGRIYKDCWQITTLSNDRHLTKEFLDKTIEAYRHASHLDTRDCYPAINYATFLRIRNDAGDIKQMRSVLDCLVYNLSVSTNLFDDDLLSIEASFNTLNLKRNADYWDMATAFEMYVLRQHQDKAWEIKDKLLLKCTEKWMLETTINNLSMLTEHIEDKPSWYESILASLRHQYSALSDEVQP